MSWRGLDPNLRLHKAHSLLQPGGWVALWWNRPYYPGDNEDLRAEIDRVYAEVAPEIAAKNSIGRIGAPAAEDVPAELSFGAVVSRCYRWTMDYRASEWGALMRTQSDHRLPPPERLDKLARRVRSAIEARGGTYHHHRACWLWAAQKLAR